LHPGYNNAVVNTPHGLLCQNPRTAGQIRRVLAPFASLCLSALMSALPKNVIELTPGMGGEDFSYFAQVVPGFYFRLGVANEEKGFTYSGHTPMYDCDEAAIKTGVAVMSAAVCDFLDAHSK
jgi:metal-dependent amidase/aminoacylase/carboxypeptidase family protein